MSVEKAEMETFLGRCRCCLSYNCLKNMWEEHQFEGEVEIYGEMLVQCFALTWDYLDEPMKQDMICEQCVCRLRDAYGFKRVVLESQAELFQQTDAGIKEETLDEEYLIEISNKHPDSEDTVQIMHAETEYTMANENDIGIKEERLDEEYLIEISNKYSDSEDTVQIMHAETEYTMANKNDIGNKEERLDEEYLIEISNKHPDSEETVQIMYAETEYTMDTTGTITSVQDETEYVEVEYLEEEDAVEVNDAVDTDSSQPTGQSKPPSWQKQPRKPDDEEAPKRKWPKKMPKSERHKTYKQYSEGDLRKCLEEVRNNVLTAAEAALKYDIPKKTICAKIKMYPNAAEMDSNREKMCQLIKEIKAILTFTNATPYKSKNVRYYCAYCSTAGPYFEDPDDLRTHTRTEHFGHRTEKIEYAMRPYWMNEVIKLDIENLLCTVCYVIINNWKEMFKHLKDKHNVVLDQAYTRVIPYVLRPDLQCAMCKESFSNYLHLDDHMNAHYNNYVCDDCGETFLAHNRLKQHVKIHNVGKFDCRLCDKVFTLEKYRRKHEDLVHQQLSKFKCIYCPEKFTGEYLRHLHCLEKHPEKIKTITCEYCGDTFTWKHYYMSLCRRKHENTKSYECNKCDRKFYRNYDLKEHMSRHVGTKNFECQICHKKYVSFNSLKQHGKQHKKKHEA